MKRRDLLNASIAAAPALRAAMVPEQPSAATAASGWITSHPRLYFNAATVSALRTRIEKDPEMKAVWARLRERAEALLKSPLVPESVAEEGGGQHANYGRPSGQISEMGLTLGLLYHMTGERRYAEKVRETMLAYTQYVRWNGQGLADRNPPWHSELNTARFLFGYGCGYDALHGFLSAADRKTIADAMVRLGILPTLNDWVLPGKRIHTLDGMGHNWWAVCVAMAGVGALALLGDAPGAQQWVERVARDFEMWFDYQGNVLQNRPANFDAAGAFYESVNYARYSLAEYLRFRYAWQNVFPGRRASRVPALERTGEFFLQTMYPTSSSYLVINFGDASLHVNAAEVMWLLAACGIQDPHAALYLKRSKARIGDTLSILLDGKPVPAPAKSVPASMVYPGIGWAVLRSSWEDDATLLAVKSGYTWNHAHPDAGSFVLFRSGVPLIIDSGNCSYSRKEYTSYYRQSRAHNVVLFNGKGQNTEDLNYGSKFSGRVHSLLDGLGMKYVYADATGPMAQYFSRNYRHWLWLDDVILIFDDLRSHEAGRFDWLLHYEGSASQEAGRGLRLVNGQAEAILQVLYPKVTMREEQGLADHQPDKKVPYFAFSPEVPSQRQRFVTAVLLSSNPRPEVELIPREDWVGVRIRHKGRIHETYLNFRAADGQVSRGTEVKPEGWVTDAYLTSFERRDDGGVASPNTVERYFVGCGSYLRKDGVSVIESISKVDAILKTGSKVDCWIHAQRIAEVGLLAQTRPERVALNGRPCQFVYRPNDRLVVVKPSVNSAV